MCEPKHNRPVGSTRNWRDEAPDYVPPLSSPHPNLVAMREEIEAVRSTSKQQEFATTSSQLGSFVTQASTMKNAFQHSINAADRRRELAAASEFSVTFKHLGLTSDEMLNASMPEGASTVKAPLPPSALSKKFGTRPTNAAWVSESRSYGAPDPSAITPSSSSSASEEAEPPSASFAIGLLKRFQDHLNSPLTGYGRTHRLNRLAYA